MVQNLLPSVLGSGMSPNSLWFSVLRITYCEAKEYRDEQQWKELPVCNILRLCDLHQRTEQATEVQTPYSIFPTKFWGSNL